MELSPELQKAITEALVVVIPALVSVFGAFAAWVVKRLQKAKKDNNAIHDYRRFILEEMGFDPIHTEWCPKTGRIKVVSRNPTSPSQTRSSNPQPLSPEVPKEEKRGPSGGDQQAG